MFLTNFFLENDFLPFQLVNFQHCFCKWNFYNSKAQKLPTSMFFINPISTGGWGCTMYHRGIFLLRTIERQMILNWHFVTFNIFLWWIKSWKYFFSKKICQLSVTPVLSRASDNNFTYSFCVVNFIGNYVKVSL